MWSITKRFGPWGDGGLRPSANSNYQGGEQVLESDLDYLWSTLRDLEGEGRAALKDLDADQDGRVSAADTTQLYKGVDVDTDGDGIVNNAVDCAGTYHGSNLDTDFQTSTLTETIGASESKYLSQTTLQDGETIDLYGVTLTTLDGSAVNAAVEIVSIASGTATVEQTVVTTDTTNTTASYTNTTGSTQIIAIRLTNNATSETEYYSDLTTRLP